MKSRLLAAMLVSVQVLFPRIARTQQIDPRGGKVHIVAPRTEDPKESLFRVGSTDLVFRYGAEFKPEDPRTLSQRSYRTIFALDPKKDPQHIGADPCSPTILSVGVETPEGNAVEKKNRDNFAASAPTGGITLVDVDRHCIHGDQSGETEFSLVSRIQQIDGLKPITPESKIVGYKLDGHQAALQIVQGFSKNRQGNREASAGVTIVGSVSMSYEDHLLVWTFIANDTSIFNRMLRCRVQFGDQPSWPLVPFSMERQNK